MFWLYFYLIGAFYALYRMSKYVVLHLDKLEEDHYIDVKDDQLDFFMVVFLMILLAVIWPVTAIGYILSQAAKNAWKND